MRGCSRQVVVVLSGLLLSTALGRPNQAAAQSGPYKSGVELVPLTVTVTDRAGRHVPHLTAADFAVFEEGQRQVLSHFATGHVPIDVAFLIDTSTSMRDSLPLAQKAACGLVQRLRAGDRGAVSGIGSRVLLHQSMTPDLARVDAALQATRADGNTALYDALYIALREYERDRPASTADVRRQVIVLLTDGIDTASHVAFETLLDAVRRLEVTIYIVSLAPDPVLTPLAGDRVASESAHALNALARESGGRLFTPRAARELPAIYDAIGDELRNQYVIAYVPAAANPNGTFRRISVGVLEPRSGTARTRSGYYAGRPRVGGPSPIAASVVR